jgi:probable rRNA maturation factor
LSRRKGAATPKRAGKIQVAWASARRPLSDAAVRRIARAALSHGERANVPLSVVFVSDAALARLHGKWLGDSRPTDVISFDLDGAGGGPVGELYVSVPCAVRQARARKLSVERELALYVVHGCLHLCGHDDHAPSARRKMRAAERVVLSKLGFEDDPTPSSRCAQRPFCLSCGY